jgi:transcriptional regulator with XRE-family HTH domain
MKSRDESGSMTFGQAIRHRRVELGLTQEELAERVGENVRQSEISRLERDYVALPRRSRLEALARALEVSPGYLLVHSGWLEDETELPEHPPTRHVQPAPEPRPYEAVLDMVEAIPNEELEESRQLQDAIARAREVSWQTGQILRDTAETISNARRHRKH